MVGKTVKEKMFHTADLAVVGGGLAGMITAISAARHGCRVVLVQDRPILGGNCSSEIRMWALGCHGKNNRETGILEEILLENMYRNPTRNYSLWDSILYGKVTAEPNITLLLNCSCTGVEMESHSKIKSIDCWQLTTYTWHTIEAKYFADCSGDSILADLSGAEYRVGRESSEEFGEDLAPQNADKKTMGLTCLIEAKETDHPVKFIPPSWANVYETDAQMHGRYHNPTDIVDNYWWMELGGEFDSIHDTEELRDELLKIAFGVWDHIKNHGDHGADNWELDWVGFLPGKRESRRCIGDHILKQSDVDSEGRFDDLVAYGGWSMDDHHPAGFMTDDAPTVFNPAPCPFGIPYRCLYSKNIENLFFAGRNISATHLAMSSCRVMATCAIIGQAVGTAAAIANKNNLSPRGVYEQKIDLLKQTLMHDDCYLPWNTEKVSELCRSAELTADCADAENLRNGINRPIGDDDNGCKIPLNNSVTYSFDGIKKINNIQFVFDSDLERETCDGDPTMRRYPMLCSKRMNMEFGFPKTMTVSFKVEYKLGGEWVELVRVKNNIQRLVRINADVEAEALRFTPLKTWGADSAHVFTWIID